jgi:hypothetical protein
MYYYVLLLRRDGCTTNTRITRSPIIVGVLVRVRIDWFRYPTRDTHYTCRKTQTHTRVIRKTRVYIT